MTVVLITRAEARAGFACRCCHTPMPPMADTQITAYCSTCQQPHMVTGPTEGEHDADRPQAPS